MGMRPRAHLRRSARLGAGHLPAVLLLVLVLPLLATTPRVFGGQAPQEDTRARAERLTAEAAARSKQDDAASLRQALPLRQEALALWTELEDREHQAQAHHAIGHIHDILGDLKQAQEAFTRALAIRRELGDARGEAETLTRIGIVYRLSGDAKRALDAYTRALELRRETGDVKGEGSTLHNLGSLYWSTGDYARALEFYTQARHARQSAGDQRGESETLIGLAMTYRMLADSTSALALYQQALAIKRAVGDRRGEALALHNIGVLYSTLGDVPRAVEYYTQAAAISRDIGDRRAESSTLTSLGISHRLLGDPRKAIEYHQQALPVLEGLKALRELAATLSNLGSSYQYLGEYGAALAAYERALPLYRQMTDRRGEAFTLSVMGRAYSETGDLQKASMRLEEARRLQQEIGDANGEADTLRIMAQAAASGGRLAEALQRVDEGLAIVESVRARVGIPALRATYPGLKQDHHALKIDLLMRLHAQDPTKGYAAQAFLASERGRARTLLEMVERARVGARGDSALAVRETELRGDVTRKATERLAATGATARQLDEELETLLREYEVLQGRMREEDLAYASLTPSLERVSDLQQLLDEDTALVEYSLGDERSFAWIVTHDGFRSVVLPEGELIESAARKYFELVTARPQRALRVRRREAAQELARLVIAPIRQALIHKRLVVVNDGALHYVPFAALPEPGRSNADGQPIPLISAREIVQLPSASVLAALRERGPARPRATKTIAVFADPIFGRADARVRRVPPGDVAEPSSTLRGGDTADPTTDSIAKAMIDTGLPRLERLVGSAREADAILALAARDAALRAVGFDAQRKLALSPSLADYRVIHFATHGLLNSRRPELSGIVLSFVDAEGRPQDGFVTLSDILSLQLNAELVVLSACRTALGRDVKGEGLVGLTRGFMAAGVPRVIASLWDVQDVSTAELMTRFYRGVFKQGQSPAAALRAAQLVMLKDPRWSEPYYWAAFTLQGDWRAY
jgi:CHAT domain-containing protein/Tfp pilus assembly protein PilF